MICANLVRSAPRFARPVYYITFRFVCQGVFQKFFQLFSWLSATRLSLRLFGGSVWHYITLSCVCQEVFQKFFQLFSWYSVRRARFSASQIGLRIISHLLDFVKRFFKGFFNFFRDILSCFNIRSLARSASRWQPLSRWQLAYYSTSSPICQGGFAKFLRFGGASTIIQTKTPFYVHIYQFLSFFAAIRPNLPRIFTPFKFFSKKFLLSRNEPHISASI